MPQNWKTYKLEDALEALIDYRGKTPKKTDSGIPLVTAKIVKNGRILEPNEFIAEQDYDSWMRRGMPMVGDVLLTTEAPLGEIAQIKNSNIALAQRIVTLRGKKELVDNGYLRYFLQSKEGQSRLIARESGTTVTGIKQSELRKVLIDCPPINQQRRIASILGALDDKIELNLEMNKTLEEMAMALYKHWFVDTSDNRESKLDDYIDLNPRMTIPKGQIAPFVEMKSLPIDQMSVSQIDKKEFNGGSKFQNNDTLFARITPCLENGKTAFVDFLHEDEIGFGSTEFLIFRAKRGISPYWVYCLSRDSTFRSFAISTMVGTSGRQRVQNDPLLLLFELPEIDYDKHTKFNEKVRAWFELIRQNTIENKSLIRTRDLLLPKLISGEIEVNVAEEEVSKVI